ncbi:hypothetical protein MYX06_01585 [Patescibacteria group bacterium AH-259-L05]|nr:hypothetical protein [Patescibacteria group bacterium AH-259-L05]
MELTKHIVSSWIVSPLEMQAQVSHCNKGITKGSHQEYTEVELKWPTCKLVTSVDGLKCKEEVDGVIKTLVRKNLLGKARTLLLDMLGDDDEGGISFFEDNKEGGQPN